MFLTADQLEELTGYRQAAAQVRWLQRNGITHYVRADGRPVVPSTAITGGAASRGRTGPDLDSVRVRH